jgi:hypothetical protein
MQTPVQGNDMSGAQSTPNLSRELITLGNKTQHSSLVSPRNRNDKRFHQGTPVNASAMAKRMSDKNSKKKFSQMLFSQTALISVNGSLNS